MAVNSASQQLSVDFMALVGLQGCSFYLHSHTEPIIEASKALSGAFPPGENLLKEKNRVKKATLDLSRPEFFSGHFFWGEGFFWDG